ncbi:MAG: glycosyltransferase family 4 protein [Oleispira sp.]
MKKIAYVLPSFPVVSETFITTEIHAMVRRGHEVLPCCFYLEDVPCHPGDESILQQMSLIPAVKPIKLLKLLKNIGPGIIEAITFSCLQQGMSFKSLFYSALKLAYLAQSNGCRHIHAHFAQGTAATAIVAAKILGVGVSFTGHGHDVYSGPADLQYKLQYADISFAVCNRMKKYFEKFNVGKNIKLLYCGVDVSNTSMAKKTHNKKILYLGRLSEIKGLFELIHAMTLIPESLRPELDIAGDGELLDELKSAVVKYSLQAWVKFLGPVNRSWLKSVSHNYRAIVLPFCRGADGCYDTGPLVLKEAMVLDLLVLTSDLIAKGEFIDERSSLVFRESDSKDIAEKIIRAMALSEAESNQYTGEAKKRVLQLFSDDASANVMSSYIEAL